MNPHFKQALRTLIEDDYTLPSVTQKKSLKFLDAVPECPEGEPFLVLHNSKGERAKRAPSPYNEFVKACFQQEDIKMMPSGDRLKACAANWKQKKRINA